MSELYLLKMPRGTVPDSDLLLLAGVATSLKWLLLGTSFFAGGGGFGVSLIWIVWKYFAP